MMRSEVPRTSGTDGEDVAQTEADHFGTGSGALIDKRALSAVLAHVAAAMKKARAVSDGCRESHVWKLERSALIANVSRAPGRGQYQ